MIVFGGLTDSIPHNDVLALTNANGMGGAAQWITLIPDGAVGSPPARVGHSAVLDSANNRLIVFGGCVTACFNDVWVLLDANGVGGAPTWQQLFPSGTAPSPRLYHTAVYDPTNNRIIIFAGLSVGGNGSLPDVWVLSNANGLGGTPTWTQLSPVGGPPLGQIGHTSIYDSSHNIMMVFGGLIDGETKSTNAAWTLSHANGLGGQPTWRNLVADEVPGSPAKRSFHTAVYDPTTNRMIVFAGSPGTLATQFAGALNDTWVLTSANGTGGAPHWTKLSPKAGLPEGILPAARANHTAFFDPVNNVMTIYGGVTFEAFFNSAWILTHANGL
jgi:hypothetical protein